MLFVFESLENRVLLSGLTPAQVEQAYGFNLVTFNFQGTIYNGTGRGETIAIVDAYAAPTIVADVKTFDAMYSLPDTDINHNFFLTVDDPQGTPNSNATWAEETTLDVEWAHAIAPKAHIDLVQAVSSSFTNLFAAVNSARQLNGVGVVSMSWAGAEFSGETADDADLVTPVGHRPETFIAATGDGGLGAQYPASSPNVVSVGGTTLTVNAQGNYISETAWSSGGGGHSSIEGTNTPTVAYDANPNTGFDVYDSTTVNGNSGWLVDAGTSGGAPQWAALITIANQGRSYAGNPTLNGKSQTLPAMGFLASMGLHDITTGSNGSAAGVGYDLATGYGTPKANLLIPSLVTYGGVGSARVALASADVVFAPQVFSSGPEIKGMDQKGADSWLEGGVGVLED